MKIKRFGHFILLAGTVVGMPCVAAPSAPVAGSFGFDWLKAEHCPLRRFAASNPGRFSFAQIQEEPHVWLARAGLRLPRERQERVFHLREQSRLPAES